MNLVVFHSNNSMPVPSSTAQVSFWQLIAKFIIFNSKPAKRKCYVFTFPLLGKIFSCICRFTYNLFQFFQLTACFWLLSVKTWQFINCFQIKFLLVRLYTFLDFHFGSLFVLIKNVIYERKIPAGNCTFRV